MIILTRNSTHNITPGYWNHAAFLTSGLQVIEVHFKNSTVVSSSYADYIARYPEVLILEFKDDGHNKKAEEFAVESIGKPFDYKLRPIKTRGAEVGTDNCVSFVRKCAEAGIGERLRWIVPDDIARSELVREVSLG